MIPNHIGPYVFKAIRFTILLLLVYSPQTFAENDSAFRGCREEGIKKLEEFDRKLRESLSKNSIEEFLALFGPTVTINYISRKTIIKNSDLTEAGSYREYFFTEDFKKSILADTHPSCAGWRGLMYADGILWVDEPTDDGPAFIKAIKATGDGPNGPVSEKSPEPIVECLTAKHRIVTDIIKIGQYRYRSWSRTKNSGKPNIELRNGQIMFEGDGSCGDSKEFKNGNTTYLLRASCASKNIPYYLEVIQDSKKILDQPCVVK